MLEALDPTAARGYEILGDMGASGADARDLSNDQLAPLRALFEDTSGAGLWLFAYHIGGCADITVSYHYPICQFLSMWGRVQLASGEWVNRPAADNEHVHTSWRRLMLVVGRDTFKSTLATRTNALWIATRDPEATIGIFNESEAKVKSWLGSIRDIIETSRLYQALWPHLLPRGIHWRDKDKGIARDRAWKWGESGIKLVRTSKNVSELTFEPYGIGGSSTGKHFTHIIKDDIIGESASDSPATMEDAINWLDHSRNIERPAGQGNELINCTRWGHHDTYSHAIEKWSDYKVYHRSMLEDPVTHEPDVVAGVSTFPERFPTHVLKAEYESDAFVFMSQRMCLPLAGRETSFQADWLRYCSVTWDTPDDEPYLKIDPAHYDPTIMDPDLRDLEDRAPNLVPLYWLSKALIIDPAPSRKTERSQEPRARNGLVLVAKDPWGRRFHLEGRPLREDPVEVLKQALDMCRRWKTTTISIEEVNFSELYQPLWSRIMRHEHPDFEPVWRPVKPEGMNKDTRIAALMGPHREGFMYYNQPESGYTLQELLEYPHSATRDLIDALAYTDKVLTRPESPGERREALWASRAVDRSRGLTGYGSFQSADTDAPC